MSNTLKSYFESKKRCLSDKSDDGDERKKAKESNLDLLINQDDAVFSEGIDTPRCASILYDCLKNSEKKGQRNTPALNYYEWCPDQRHSATKGNEWHNKIY